MTISAKVIADSISPTYKRLTTLQLRYPRFIHAEFMTHRVFSRNASSSRAVPVERMIQDVIDDPAMPLFWGRNQRGMQAVEECNEPVAVFGVGQGTEHSREKAWLLARDKAVEAARAFANAGYHKQIVNRLLEPWLHINVVVTATEWSNFFSLRLHKDAQPEIQELARCIRAAMADSIPMPLQPGEWHLPYTTDDDVRMLEDSHPQEVLEYLTILSVARCASVSYMTVDGRPMTLDRATAIYAKLVSGEVFHASPFEHQATPDRVPMGGMTWCNPELHGNFVGWVQLRKQIEQIS